MSLPSSPKSSSLVGQLDPLHPSSASSMKNIGDSLHEAMITWRTSYYALSQDMKIIRCDGMHSLTGLLPSETLTLYFTLYLQTSCRVCGNKTACWSGSPRRVQEGRHKAFERGVSAAVLQVLGSEGKHIAACPIPCVCPTSQLTPPRKNNVLEAFQYGTHALHETCVLQFFSSCSWSVCYPWGSQ